MIARPAAAGLGFRQISFATIATLADTNTAGAHG
jgi:hypothetical protein